MISVPRTVSTGSSATVFESSSKESTDDSMVIISSPSPNLASKAVTPDSSSLSSSSSSASSGPVLKTTIHTNTRLTHSPVRTKRRVSQSDDDSDEPLKKQPKRQFINESEVLRYAPALQSYASSKPGATDVVEESINETAASAAGMEAAAAAAASTIAAMRNQGATIISPVTSIVEKRHEEVTSTVEERNEEIKSAGTTKASVSVQQSMRGVSANAAQQQYYGPQYHGVLQPQLHSQAIPGPILSHQFYTPFYGYPHQYPIHPHGYYLPYYAPSVVPHPYMVHPVIGHSLPNKISEHQQNPALVALQQQKVPATEKRGAVAQGEDCIPKYDPMKGLPALVQKTGTETSLYKGRVKVSTDEKPSVCFTRCVPLQEPIPSKHWAIDEMQHAPLPEFHRLVNFPDYLSKSRGFTAGDTCGGKKNCVMCGKKRVCSASGLNEKVRSVVSNDEDDDMDGHIIPKQNKGLCTACDVAVWVFVGDGSNSASLEIKWCKGCKNFRHWAAFGQKGSATKCGKCRNRQKQKYARQKEETRVRAQRMSNGNRL